MGELRAPDPRLARVFCAAAVRAADPLPQVFSCGKQGSVGGLGSGTDLTRHVVDTTRFRDHESFTTDSPVFQVRINGTTWHDAVWNWWVGAQPQALVRAFTGVPGKAPECP